MNNSRNQYSEDERILATIVDTAGNLVTGSTSLILTIQRESDGYYYDFSDASFKASGWTSSGQAMTQLDSTGNPGTYYYDFDASAQGTFSSQKNYYLRATSTSADNSPVEGYLKLGGWIDSVGVSGGFTQIGSQITQEVVDEIAKRVWKVVLKGKDTASDILLRKSEFDATKDYVLYTKNEEMYINLQNIKDEIKKIKFPDNSEIIKAINKLKPIDFNPILKKVLDKIELTVSFFNQGKNDIIKSIESQVYNDSDIRMMMEECKTMISMMCEDMCERMDTIKEMDEEIKSKSEEMDDSHKEKMHEMMMKLEEEGEENKKNIKKILLKMTELKFDSDHGNLDDFYQINEKLEIILDHLEGKI